MTEQLNVTYDSVTPRRAFEEIRGIAQANKCLASLPKRLDQITFYQTAIKPASQGTEEDLEEVADSLDNLKWSTVSDIN